MYEGTVHTCDASHRLTRLAAVAAPCHSSTSTERHRSCRQICEHKVNMMACQQPFVSEFAKCLMIAQLSATDVSSIFRLLQ